MTAELVVLVDGHERKITGEVKDSTTVEIVTALANATNKLGKFSLILLNRTNGVEYFLRKSDCPWQILKALKDRGIDACLEVRDVVQISRDPYDYSNQSPDQKIYASLPQRFNEFERMLAEMSDVELEELVQEQSKILWQHQIKIVGLEETIEESDQEYLQLLKQRHNLRQTIAELNSIDWKRQQNYEIKQLNRINSTINRLEQELSEKQLHLEQILLELNVYN
ncbi:hypothetical protein M3Y97_00858300 [Aphelenchoides bicaudatus]|nr:hypothetical protein M3Y97_00858300 [Aphelenchoides bicaudatus]